MKKLTYEYVKGQIEKTGYKLLSEKYENAHTKLEVQCPKEHIYKVRWYNFQQGDRCPVCGNKKGKLVYDYVKTFIESKRYKLLSKEYKNSWTKLQMRCSKGHKFKMTWHNFQQGTRCPICNDQRFTYKYIEKEIKKRGYKLLDKEYVNNHTKLKLQCPKGHTFKMTWKHFQRGQGCPICSIDKQKHDYKYIKRQIKKTGYELLSKKYINGHTRLRFQCPMGHKFRMRWNNFQQGQKCHTCNIDRKRHTYEYVKERINKKGYEILSEKYINNCTKLEIQCSRGHKFEMDWNKLQQSRKCPICQANSFASKAEKEIADIIEVQGIKVKRNDRTQITNPLTNNKLELDIWMPGLNKAIEYNGEYWHSFKDKIIKDKIKLQECTKKGIELLVIKEQDWINNKTGCINKIKNFVKNKTMLAHSEVA